MKHYSPIFLYVSLLINNLQDEKLVQSVSLTERVKLWDKFDDRVNHHAVKMEFLKKAHRKDPPFRIKYRHPRRRTSTVCFFVNQSCNKETYEFDGFIMQEKSVDSNHFGSVFKLSVRLVFSEPFV